MRVHRYIITGLPVDNKFIDVLYPFIKSGIICTINVKQNRVKDTMDYSISNFPINKQRELIDALLKAKIITKTGKNIHCVEEDERNLVR